MISDELKGLEDFGVDNRPVAITWDVITKINKKHLEVEFKYLENLGNLLEDEQYIVDGMGTNKGNKLVVTSQKDSQDRFLVVAVEPNKDLRGAVMVNEIRSTYGRNNLENYLINNSDRVQEIKKSSNGARIQFPMQVTTYINNIQNIDESVNHKNQNCRVTIDVRPLRIEKRQLISYSKVTTTKKEPTVMNKNPQNLCYLL